MDVPIYAILKLAVLSLCTVHAAAWGSSSSSSEVNSAVYGSALDRDWLYDGSALSLKLEGCVWGYVDDSENAGCMAQSSEDGTTYWYQMANCRRAQAVFSVYASSGNNAACNSGNFKESVCILLTCSIPKANVLAQQILFHKVCHYRRAWRVRLLLADV